MHVSLKITEKDFLWVELNSEYDLHMFVINPGDDIFIPFFLFPITPVNTYLSQDLAWTQIRLTKETKRERSIKDKPCNDKDDYIYGGTR